ncbi:hypothetical protein [Gemella cuniculi]|uniref:hypothetical protein n=1 Tax=Gemella cuniculi TaxID=150240 RepID=UPI0003F8DCCF|nr:hypothetical protein [Gemella cuniculi]
MKINRYFSVLGSLVLVFMFLYTFKLNFDLSRKLNVFNFGVTFLIFILWLVAGYLFLIKDVLKSPEKEKNGIVLVLVLLAIIFFYYNPLPNPDNFFVEIPRVTFFLLTLVIFILLVVIFWKETLTLTIFAIFIPITAQSYLVNILSNTTYTSYTLYIVIVFVAFAYGINYFKNK